jgi:hypothetical protein
MIKRIILIEICLLILAGCIYNDDEYYQNPKKKCSNFYDCLPENILPGETGCGGCYPDENRAELCYEFNEDLCNEYKTKYKCDKGVCKIS